MLEVCVDTIESAVNASKGGAKRLELCSSLCLGGLTPSVGMYKTIRSLVRTDCDIFVMIRPRQGVYVYNSNEIRAMVEDIEVFKQNNVNGFVFGCLTPQNEIDVKSCSTLLAAAGYLPSTFHRAFDMMHNPEENVKILSQLGFSRVLTSGQEENAFLGRHTIKKLVTTVRELNSGLIVVAGGGISPTNLKEILKETEVTEYHGSARAHSHIPSDGLYLTDEAVVRELIRISEAVLNIERNKAVAGISQWD